MKTDCFALARQMRGKVEEFDDTYIEQWLPTPILERLQGIGPGHDIDDEGFWWGPKYVFATKLKNNNNEIVVAVATKPMGMGHHELKVVDQHGNLRTEEGYNLL